MSFICVICRDALTSTTSEEEDKQLTIVATKCGHLFHFPCLSNWFHQSWRNLDADSQPRCPCCKTMSYVHELVRVYPAQENGPSNVLTTSTMSSEMVAMAVASKQFSAIQKDYNELVENFQGARIGNVAGTHYNDNGNDVKNAAIHNMEALGEDMKRLQHDFEEISAMRKSSEVRWASHREKQRQEIVYLKRQNEKLYKESKCQTITAKSQGKNAGDDSITAEIPLKDQLIDNYTDGGFGVADSPSTSSECWLQQSSNACTYSSKIQNEDYCIRLGDKVVWTINDKPETGVVKWKGFVGSRIYAGIEFERQLGIPIGDVHTDSLQYIFSFKPGHGRLVPVQELTLYQQFYSDVDKRKSRKLSLQKLKMHACSQQ